MNEQLQRFLMNPRLQRFLMQEVRLVGTRLIITTIVAGLDCGLPGNTPLTLSILGGSAPLMGALSAVFQRHWAVRDNLIPPASRIKIIAKELGDAVVAGGLGAVISLASVSAIGKFGIFSAVNTAVSTLSIARNFFCRPRHPAQPLPALAV